MSRLLITGASGCVGTGLRPYLRETHELHLFDRVRVEGLQPNETFFCDDITNFSAIDAAIQGCNGVVHLAAVHGLKINFEETLNVNYRGTINVMEAARISQVNHVVFASSNHGWGFYKRDATPLRDCAPVAPDGWYGVNKIWGEAVMAFYAEAYGMATNSLRIGNANSNVVDERRLHMWISFRDLAGLINACLERRDTGHKTAFAMANCPDPYFDNSGVAELGYRVGDKPADNLSKSYNAQQAPHDWLGGDFAHANARRDQS